MPPHLHTTYKYAAKTTGKDIHEKESSTLCYCSGNVRFLHSGMAYQSRPVPWELLSIFSIGVCLAGIRSLGRFARCQIEPKGTSQSLCVIALYISSYKLQFIRIGTTPVQSMAQRCSVTSLAGEQLHCASLVLHIILSLTLLISLPFLSN